MAFARSRSARFKRLGLTPLLIAVAAVAGCRQQARSMEVQDIQRVQGRWFYQEGRWEPRGIHDLRPDELKVLVEYLKTAQEIPDRKTQGYGWLDVLLKDGTVVSIGLGKHMVSVRPGALRLEPSQRLFDMLRLAAQRGDLEEDAPPRAFLPP